MSDIHLITGAFGYSGQYIARRLINKNCAVRTLTNSGNRSNALGDRIQVYSYNFDDYGALLKSFEGVSVFYNTYWVRFNHPMFQHSTAVQNTLKLFRAAKEAGVKRVVHVSITNPSENSDLEYFRGKAMLERALKESGMSYAILRPTVLFGKEDILINNIAWILRHFPVFGIFGDGDYQLQPIYVDDLAELAIREGESRENRTLDAIGPETFAFKELVESIATIIGCNRPLVRVPPFLGLAVGWLLGKLVKDVVITPEEIKGLMRNLLVTTSPPAGKTRLTDWARQNAATLGRHYSSELARRRDRTQAYEKL